VGPDGKELFYAAPDRRLVAVPVKIGLKLRGWRTGALFEGVDLLDLAVKSGAYLPTRGGRPAVPGERAAGGDARQRRL